MSKVRTYVTTRRPRFRWRSLFRAGWSERYWSYALGYDVACECGWESRTGGAIRASVMRAIDDHLLDEHDLISVHGKVIGELS